MTFSRFSVRELLGFVTFLAVGTTALLYASAGWTIVVVSAALVFLLISALGAVVARGEQRGFWTGVAVIGWAYVFLIEGWPFESRALIRPLPTTELLRLAWEDVLPYVRDAPNYFTPISVGRIQHPPFGSDVQFDPGTKYPSPIDYVRIGQALWTLLIAYLGGRLGRYFYLTRSRDDGRAKG